MGKRGVQSFREGELMNGNKVKLLRKQRAHTLNFGFAILPASIWTSATLTFLGNSLSLKIHFIEAAFRDSIFLESLF